MMVSMYFVDNEDRKKLTLFAGVNAFVASGENMTLSLVEMSPGSEVEPHSHPHEQVGMLIEGQARFFVGDEERVLHPGDMYRIPGGVEHRVVALENGAKALDCFHPVRTEYQ